MDLLLSYVLSSKLITHFPIWFWHWVTFQLDLPILQPKKYFIRQQEFDKQVFSIIPDLLCPQASCPFLSLLVSDLWVPDHQCWRRRKEDLQNNLSSCHGDFVDLRISNFPDFCSHSGTQFHFHCCFWSNWDCCFPWRCFSFLVLVSPGKFQICFVYFELCLEYQY